MAEEKRPLLPPEVDASSIGSVRWSIRSLWYEDLFPVVPARYMLAVMGFLGFFNVYALRVNLSMAIVAMVNETADPSSKLVRACCSCVLLRSADLKSFKSLLHSFAAISLVGQPARLVLLYKLLYTFHVHYCEFFCVLGGLCLFHVVD